MQTWCVLSFFNDLFSNLTLTFLLIFMYILTCVLKYYYNKQTESLSCLTEQWNNFIWKLSVLLIYIYIYSGLIIYNWKN